MSRGHTPSAPSVDADDPGVGSIASLWHPKNIQRGRGRIVWAIESEKFPAGWVLPGGRRTDNESEAIRAADMIDRACRAMP